MAFNCYGGAFTEQIFNAEWYSLLCFIGVVSFAVRNSVGMLLSLTLTMVDIFSFCDILLSNSCYFMVFITKIK